MVSMTAAQFNRAPSAVKRLVIQGGEPVVVTDRDRPSVVVLSYDAYLAMSGQPLITDMAAWLEMDEDIDFEPPTAGFGLREVDL